VKQIWKYRLWEHKVEDFPCLRMPYDARILSVQMQDEVTVLWALVDPDMYLESRFFRVAGTGHPIRHELGVYIDTFQMNGGALIFHVFEISPEVWNAAVN